MKDGTNVCFANYEIICGFEPLQWQRINQMERITFSVTISLFENDSFEMFLF